MSYRERPKRDKSNRKNEQEMDSGREDGEDRTRRDRPKRDTSNRQQQEHDRDRGRDDGEDRMYLGKLFYQVLQLLHHATIARDQANGKLPLSFQKKVAQLSKFLRPARPTPTTRNKLQEVNVSWAKQIGATVLNHYRESLERVTATLREFDPSRETFWGARLTALRWGHKNFGKKLQEYTVTKFGETLREIFHISGTGNVGKGCKHPKRSAATATHTSDPRQNGSKDTASGRQRHKTPTRIHVSVSERGINGNNSSPRHSDQPNLARAPPFINDRLPELASNSRRGVPHTNKHNVFVSSETYLADIDSACDPAHPSYQCDVTFEDSFNNAVFPSGTHALAYARAVSLDMGPLSDAVFRANTGVEVERLCRAFPAETAAWRVHAEGLLWQTFEWKMAHDPAFSRRIHNSGDTSFKLATPCGHWGTGPDGKGNNVYGQLLSEFRDVQLGRGEWVNLSRTTDRESEVNTDHDNGDSTSLDDMTEDSATAPRGNDKVSTESQASVSTASDTPPVTPHPDTVDSLNLADISMGSQSDDSTVTAPGDDNTGQPALTHTTGQHHTHDGPRTESVEGGTTGETGIYTDGRLYSTVTATQVTKQATGYPILRACPTPGSWRLNLKSPTRVNLNSPTPTPAIRPQQSPKYLVEKTRHPKSAHKLTDWFLEAPRKGTLVIGDSNVSNITSAPVDHVYTESYPGAQITHIHNILGQMEQGGSSQPDCVILSVGINDRGNRPVSTAIPAMRKLAQRANKQFPRAVIAIPKINCPKHLSQDQRDNIKQLNKSLATFRNVRVIPELADDKFETLPGDIHWTKTTGNAMMRHWLSSLN